MNIQINKFYSYSYDGAIPYYFLYETNAVELKKDLEPPYTSYTYYGEDVVEFQQKLSARIKQKVSFVKLDPGTLIYVIEIDPEESDDGFQLYHVIAGDKFGWMLVEKQPILFIEVTNNERE